VEILIRGTQIEKLINLATSSGLYLWGIRRIAPEIVYAKIRVHGYLRIREMVKISGCRVKIHHKHGLPFLYRKLMERRMFLVGAVFFGALLVYLSSFVLIIKIEG
jgi:similar to stage IV sporulation protein